MSDVAYYTFAYYILYLMCFGKNRQKPVSAWTV